MSIRIRIFVAIIFICSLLFIFRMVNKKKVGLKISLKWIAFCFLALLLDAFPNTLDWLSRLVGIELPSNMIFLIAIIVITITNFMLTISVSRLTEITRQLSQELALAKDEIEGIKASCYGEEDDK